MLHLHHYMCVSSRVFVCVFLETILVVSLTKKRTNAMLEIISSNQPIHFCNKMIRDVAFTSLHSTLLQKKPTPNSYHPEGGLMSKWFYMLTDCLIKC